MNNISFKGCIPVEYYAKNPKTNRYVPIVQEQNVKKCQRYVVGNLNGTIAIDKRNDVFVSLYKKIDKDYAKTPIARAHYDKYAPIPKTIHEKTHYYTYLFTGSDTDKIKQLGKQLGKEKTDIFEATGEKDNGEIRQAQRRYRAGIKDLINRLCPRVKDELNNKLVMRMFFTPIYDKKGNLSDFKFQDVMFYPQGNDFIL